MTKVIANNGKTYNFPDNLSLSDIRAYLDNKVGKNNYEVQASDDGVVKNFLKGAKIGLVDTALGVEQAIRKIDPRVSEREKELQKTIDKRKIDNEAVLKTKAGTIGNIAGTIAPAIPTFLIPGVNTVTGSAALGAALGATQPVATGESRTLNTVLGAGGGIVGKLGGDKVAKIVGNKLNKVKADNAIKKAQNQQADDLLRKSQEAGYVVPPAQVNPRGRTLMSESLAGKANIQQGAALKNQEVTNNLAKKSLGISDDTPLTIEAVENVKTQAGKVYEELKNVGDIKLDQTFKDNILFKSLADYDTNIKDFDSLKNPYIEKLAKDLLGDIDTPRTSFNSNAIVTLVKRLGQRAKLDARSTDPLRIEASFVQRDIANELLDLVERNLIKNKADIGLINRFKDAKVKIAKANTVLNALDSQGNVVAGKIKGDFLTDELKLISDFAEFSPRSVQPLNKSMGSSSPLDVALGVQTAAITGNPTMLAAPIVRPLATKFALSNRVQSKLATPASKYEPSLGLRMLNRSPLSRFGLLSGASVGANTQGGLLQ